MKLITNGRLITRDAEGRGYYEHGAVAYEGAKIAEVGEEAALRAKYPDAEIVDAKGGVIMPAFINAHTHIYSALARGLSIVGNNPTNFYEVLDGTWWAIDRHLMMDGTKASATALYIDSIKQGVTTVFDHHASYGEIPGTLHTIAEESKRLGLRSCLCYEVSDRDGEEKCLQAIKENADFITECEQRKDPMLAAMFGGHALFTISDKTFDRMVETNNGRTGYHIHVSEGMNDVYDSLQNYGRRPVQRLQDHGILGEKTILGHCIHVNAAEMELIASKADVIAAKAAFYPSLVLGASGGFNAFDVGKWFHSPASLVYDLAAGITAPIFRRNEIRSMWNEAKASQRIALSQYHETALNAYTEVLDLYCASQTQTERIRLKEKESLAHQRSVVNAGEMFQLSYTGFLEVLSAEERYLDSELEHIDIVTDLCRKKILLYRALGGGC